MKKTVVCTLTKDSMNGKNLMDMVGFTQLMTSIFSVKVACIVIKYSGLAIGFGPFLGENLWQLSRLA